MSDDRGSATVWAAGATAALLVLGTVGIDLASAVRARHVAESAADLTALVAAGRATEGTGGACPAARTAAERNGAALTECRVEGWDAVVRVEVRRGWSMVARGPAVAAARAGPAPLDAATATTGTPGPGSGSGSDGPEPGPGTPDGAPAEPTPTTRPPPVPPPVPPPAPGP